MSSPSRVLQIFTLKINVVIHVFTVFCFLKHFITIKNKGCTFTVRISVRGTSSFEGFSSC